MRLVAPLCVALLVIQASLPCTTCAQARGQAELAPLVRDLASSDPFVSELAASEIRQRGTSATRPLLKFYRDPNVELRYRVRVIVEDLIQALVLDLDRETRTIHLDRRDLALLETRRKAAEELKPLRKTFKAWTTEIPDLEDKLRSYFAFKALKEKEETSDAASDLSAEERAELARLRGEIWELEKSVPDLKTKAETAARIVALESLAGPVPDLDEKETLRMEELRKRVSEREPRVEALVQQLRALGPPAYSVLAAHLAFLPLQDAPLPGTRKSAVAARYEKILADALRNLREDGLLPTDADFEFERYDLSLLWALELDSKGPASPAAEKRLAQHVDLTLGDLKSPHTLVSERAEVELFRLGRRGLRALLASDDSAETRFFAELLRWRVHPTDFRKFGIHFNDYQDLPFTARRRRIFRYARTAGVRATPTLRAVVQENDLEPSFLVKYAAAKALATYAGDRLGFLILQAQHPETVLKRPEISRDLRLLEGIAHVRSKNYALAVEEFAKILEQFPFDFEGNYHIAFAYLLLKDYPRAIHHFEIARRINPKDQLTLYNLACAYSLGGKLEEALKALSESVDAGFHDADHIEKDPDLDGIRETPEYRSILEKARAAK